MPFNSDTRPACAETNIAMPFEVSCGGCGAELEVWSDEPEVPCPKCGGVISHTVDAC